MFGQAVALAEELTRLRPRSARLGDALAGRGLLEVLAVERLADDARERGLAAAARPAEQKRVVHAAGRSQEVFERFLIRKKIRPDVMLVTPHFMSLPAIIGKSDFVATVPHAIGMYFSGAWANIRTALPPFPEAPRIVLKQYWHRKAHQDPRNQWLRKLVYELFNQESDEWKTNGND